MNIAALDTTSRESEETFLGHDGLRLNLRSWRPAETPRASLVIIHGFKAHSGQYSASARQLVQAGVAVYALDLRGHGKSDGERFWVDEFSDYVADLEQLVRLVRDRQPNAPLFLLGHSVGGVVASLFALEYPSQLAGLITESFAFELPPPSIALALMKGLDHVAPRAKVLALKDEDFSRDPAVVASMKADPLITQSPGPTHTLAEMIRAGEKLRKNLAVISTPVLVLHGTADRATRPSGSQHFFDGVGSVDKTLELYEDGVHDLLHDLDKVRVLADIIEWIGMRIPS
ncbi:MAG TPA: alpha/beta hydrolase [Polyangiaceae bacterium]|nr:alpha/beta hydrolase [Polyangiaceae bacterium]